MGIRASDYDQSRFLRAEDLTAEKKFRIKNVTEEVVGQDSEKKQKLIVWFTNDKRGLVLNKVNNRTIRTAFGDDTDGWAGKIIAIFPTHVDMRGKMVPALRVRIPPPKQATAAPVATPQPQPPTGNGAAAPQATTTPPTQAAPVADPELEPDAVKPLDEEMGDIIPF
jgi:hypothetical protein